jgi:hypothetical protein
MRKRPAAEPARAKAAEFSTFALVITVTEKPQPVHLAGSVLDRSRHTCAFFHSKDEEYNVLLPFMEEGFEHGAAAMRMLPT